MGSLLAPDALFEISPHLLFISLFMGMPNSDHVILPVCSHFHLLPSSCGSFLVAFFGPGSKNNAWDEEEEEKGPEIGTSSGSLRPVFGSIL